MRYYQLFLFGDIASFNSTILPKLKQQYQNLGLSPDEYLQVFNGSSEFDRVDFKGIPLGVWYACNSEPTKTEIQNIRKLQTQDAEILPIVNDGDDCQVVLPGVLHRHINICNGNNPDAAVTAILRMQRLIPQERKVFISYRRQDSANVAWQLHQALVRAHYNVFLDVASIDGGENFPNKISYCLNDADLFILLNTNGINNSSAVQDEITQINQHGCGVFQIIWPDQKPTSMQTFWEHRQLSPEDFDAESRSPDIAAASQRLLPTVVNSLVRKIESIRIRSLAAKRQNLHHCFKKYHPEAKFFENSSRELWCVSPPDYKIRLIWPFLQIPNALSIYEREKRGVQIPERIKTDQELASKIDFNQKVKGEVLYRQTGLNTDILSYLRWLEERLQINFFPVPSLVANAEPNSSN